MVIQRGSGNTEGSGNECINLLVVLICELLSSENRDYR